MLQEQEGSFVLKERLIGKEGELLVPSPTSLLVLLHL